MAGDGPAQEALTLAIAERLYPLPPGCWKPAAEAHAEVQAMAQVIRAHWALRVVPCSTCGAPIQAVQDGPRRAIIDADSAEPWHTRLRKQHRYHRCPRQR